MNSIASKYRFCQQVVKYSLKYGATKASVRYKVCRKVIYDWRKKYDGTWKSLMPRSRRPHHPREHTPEEYELIRRHYPYYKDDKIRLLDKLREKGYTRCYKKYASRNQAHESESIARQAQGIQAQTVCQSGISGTEDAGRREICSHILCSKWEEILPVYRCGRMCSVVFSGNV